MNRMDQNLDAMKLALRVLNAINEKQYPDRQDVAELRRLAPEEALNDTNELAREVIQRALERRAECRAKDTGTK